MLLRFPRLVLAVLALLLLATLDAKAAAQRTFVASSGNDANPCSITLPCRSLAAALAQTNAGGAIALARSTGGTVSLHILHFGLRMRPAPGAGSRYVSTRGAPINGPTRRLLQTE